MLAIEAYVIAEASQQDNGRWAFEGKDTVAWLAEAERLRKRAEQDPAVSRDDADELYIISGILQALDNNETPA